MNVCNAEHLQFQEALVESGPSSVQEIGWPGAQYSLCWERQGPWGLLLTPRAKAEAFGVNQLQQFLAIYPVPGSLLDSGNSAGKKSEGLAAL